MKKIALILFTLPFLYSCKEDLKINFSGQTMGSYYNITYYHPEEVLTMDEVDSFLRIFNKSLSTWDSTSLISQLNNAPRQFEPDSFFLAMYKKSKQVWELSNGLFDPSASPLFEAWGFGLKNAEKMDSSKVDSLKMFVGMDKSYLQGNTLLKTMPQVKFSFNAIAPGYAADLIAQLLLKKGVDDFLIDIGGEFISHGKKPDGSDWKVGIEQPVENPDGKNGTQAIITLQNNEALATSGNYRKFYYRDGKKYSHTINPKTGYPVTHNLLSVTIVAPDATTADAYATTCMVMGLEDAKQFVAAQKGIKAYFIYDDGGKYGEFVTENLIKQLSK